MLRPQPLQALAPALVSVETAALVRTAASPAVVGLAVVGLATAVATAMTGWTSMMMTVALVLVLVLVPVLVLELARWRAVATRWTRPAGRCSGVLRWAAATRGGTSVA